MAAEIDIDQTVVINFAQKLAGNEATLRNRAVKKLRKWIVSKSNATKGGLNHDDLLKLWKGLHYCMWMSDKPLVQEELSRNLSSLVHSFKDIKGAMTFIDAGLETEAREWGKIDKLRLDKFMMFVRNILQESLLVMQKHKYKVHALKKLTEVFSKTVCSIDKEEIPDGIRFHFADIYVSEIERICAKEVKSKQITVLLEPYVSMITETKNFSVAEHVAKQVFEELGEKVVDAALQQAEEEEEEEVDKENAPTLEIDLSKVADLLFARASEKNTLTRNRNLIYSIVTKLRNILEGNVGEEEDMEEGEEEDLEADIEKAVSRLEKFNKTLVDKPEKRKRKSSESEEPKNNKKIKAEKVVKTKKMERNENKKQKSAEKKVKKKSDPVQKAAKKDTIKDNLFEGGFFDSDEEDTSKTEVKTKASNSENKKDKNKNKVDTEPQNPGALNSDQTISNHMEGKTKKRRKSNVEKGNICIETNGTPAAEAVQEAKRSPTPNKKKRRKSDIMKETESETSENLSNTPNSEEKPGVCIEKVTQSGKKNRRKSEKIEEKDLPVTTASETAVNENIAVSPANSVSSSKKQKRRNSVLSTSVGTVSPSSETVQASNHSVSDQSLVPSLKNSLKKKRKSMGGIDAPKENVAARSKEAEDIKLGNAAGAEEEIEIWIPSKKYKGALKGKHEQQQESAAAAKSAARGEVFAQFQSGVKTPAAFVRKAMNKVATPKTEQGKKKQAESTETPGSSAGGKKRLSFVLHKNQAQSIYDYTKSVKTTPVAFNPAVRPEVGILKQSPAASPVNSPSAAFLKKRRSKAADFF